MRKLAAACALASLTLVAGCGSDDSPDNTAAASTSSEQTQSSSAAAPSSSAAAPSSSAAAPSSAAESTGSSGGAGTPTQLTGTVGSADDPNAFVITLTDSAGQPVTTLPAGDYSITVEDLSSIHNFHLKGGDVDEKTTVPEVVDTTFDVTLSPGDYSFVCDPHPKMTGSFTVS